MTIDFAPSSLMKDFRFNDLRFESGGGNDTFQIPSNPNRVLLVFHNTQFSNITFAPYTVEAIDEGFQLGANVSELVEFSKYGAVVGYEWFMFVVDLGVYHVWEVIYDPPVLERSNFEL